MDAGVKVILLLGALCVFFYRYGRRPPRKPPPPKPKVQWIGYDSHIMLRMIAAEDRRGGRLNLLDFSECVDRDGKTVWLIPAGE